MGFLQDRLVTYSMVLSVGFLLLVSLVISAGLTAVSAVVGGFLLIDAAAAHTRVYHSALCDDLQICA
jgi:hypothetical protein